MDKSPLQKNSPGTYSASRYVTVLPRLLSGARGRHASARCGVHPEAKLAQNVLESASSPLSLLPSLYCLPEQRMLGEGQWTQFTHQVLFWCWSFHIHFVQNHGAPSPCTKPAFLCSQEALPHLFRAPWMPSLFGTPHTRHDPHGASLKPSGADTFSRTAFLFSSLYAAPSFQAGCPLQVSSSSAAPNSSSAAVANGASCW